MDIKSYCKFLILCILLVFNDLYSLEEAFLIDFHRYEDMIDQEDCCLTEDNLYPQKYKNALEAIQGNYLFDFSKHKFEVYKQNYQFKNWLSYTSNDSFYIGSHKEALIFKLKRFAHFNLNWHLNFFLSEFEQNLFKKALHFKLDFSDLKKYYVIKPYYHFYPYNKNGQPIHHKNGIIHNLFSQKDIRYLRVRIGIFGNPEFRNFNSYLVLKDWNGERYTFPLSNFDFKNSGQHRYYQNYENGIFKNEIDQSLIHEHQHYYIVFFYQEPKNYYAYSWYQNTKLIYTEVFLDWLNDDFLNLNQRYQLEGAKSLRKKIKVNFYPYFAFDRFVIDNHQGLLNQESIHFVLHDIKIEYLPYLKDSFKRLFDLDNQFFPIFKQYAEKHRNLIELKNAKKIFELIHLAFQKGIFLFEDFFKWISI